MVAARPIWRGLRVVEHLFTGASIAVVAASSHRLGAPPQWLPGAVRWWHARLCRALGVKVRVSGRPDPRCLLVANHISWLDIPALGAQAPLGFLSKAEVRAWPLVGWMAEVAGTLFITRGGHQTGAMASRIADDIARGRSLMVFPEGTTSMGLGVRRFHPRLFAIAQQPGLGVQPVALSYRHGDDPRPDSAVPFVGEDTLLASLMRILRHPDLIAEVRFLPPIAATAADDRRALSSRARLAIVTALGFPEHAGLDGESAATHRRPRPGPLPGRVPRQRGPSGHGERSARRCL